MSGFITIFSPLVSYYSLASPTEYETEKSHFRVPSPDDASAAMYGGYPEPVYKPKKKDESPRKYERKQNRSKNFFKSFVGKHFQIKEVKQTEKKSRKSKPTKGKKFWRFSNNSKHKYTDLDKQTSETKSKNTQSKITLQDVANCLESIRVVSVFVPYPGY